MVQQTPSYSCKSSEEWSKWPRNNERCHESIASKRNVPLKHRKTCCSGLGSYELCRWRTRTCMGECSRPSCQPEPLSFLLQPRRWCLLRDYSLKCILLAEPLKTELGTR